MLLVSISRVRSASASVRVRQASMSAAVMGSGANAASEVGRDNATCSSAVRIAKVRIRAR